MAMNYFLMQTDANGMPVTFAVPFAEHVDVRVLAPNTAETVTVPTDARFVVFSSSEDFYTCISGPATVPTVDVTDGSGSELNPVIRSLAGITSFSVIAGYDAIVSMAFFK